MFPKVESRMTEATTSLFSGEIGLKCHQMSVVDTVGWWSEQGLRVEREVGSEAGSACTATLVPMGLLPARNLLEQGEAIACVPPSLLCRSDETMYVSKHHKPKKPNTHVVIGITPLSQSSVNTGVCHAYLSELG